MEEAKEFIKLTIEDNGIATVTFNRPKAMNSLSLPMFTYLAEIFESLSENAIVKVIILTGVGQGFCAGVDLNAAKNVFKKPMEKDPLTMMNRCKQPIIGAVNGHAITAGFEIALACDILIASTSAKFMDTHAKFGIFPSWGLSQKLSRVIGVTRAKHVSLTSMPVDANTAERWGLVSQVVPPADLVKSARFIAEAILRNHEKLVPALKAVITDGGKLPLGEALVLEKDRALVSYEELTDEDFRKMEQFIAARSKPKQTSAKL